MNKYMEEKECNIEPSNLEKEGNKFIEIFGGLESLNKSGDKIGIANGTSYVSWDWFQGVQRAYYHENRETMIVFLTNNFMKYKSYFDSLLTAIRHYVDIGDDTVNIIAEIIRIHKDKCNKWVVGLCKLKERYRDDKSIVNSLECLIEDIRALQHTRI